MAGVLADLALDHEAAVLLVMRIARASDGDTEHARAFARAGEALAKLLLAGRCPGFVFACMECLGGAGYVEESPTPRLFREWSHNGIWEGSGNVIALDLLRTPRREPVAAEALHAEVEAAMPLDAGFKGLGAGRARSPRGWMRRGGGRTGRDAGAPPAGGAAAAPRHGSGGAAAAPPSWRDSYRDEEGRCVHGRPDDRDAWLEARRPT